MSWVCLHMIAKAQNLSPTALMTYESKWLVQALEQAHYSKVSVDDLPVEAFLDRYFAKLDKQKLYFTEKEVEKFKNKYSTTIISLFKQGNLLPGFEIFNSYKNNAMFRLERAIETLQAIPELDSNASFVVDRSKLQWAKTNELLDETWNSYIIHDFINECIERSENNESKMLHEESSRKLFAEVTETLVTKYERWKKNIEEYESSDIQELYLTAFTQMFDPHTTFMNIKEKEKFDQAMNNEFVGIGAVLSDVDGFCTIKELLPGGPAEASRELEPEDIILKVAQSEGEFVDVVDMKLSKIVELIKGPKDTLVRLTIRPSKNPSTSKVVKIIRDKIKLTANLASGKIFKISHGEEEKLIGSIELPSFYGSMDDGPKATDDVEELINKFKQEKVEGIILDLRRNGGGYLSEAVNLTGLFISRGPVVQVKNTDGSIRKKFDFNPKLSWNGPLAVLVSRFSASASEIVAGALKNHKRAIIVGDSSTHGKGTVQSLIQMNTPFNFTKLNQSKKIAAKITIQKYYLPSGKSTQINGVSSDIALPSINDFRPIGESDLDYALENDHIPPVMFRRPKGEFVYQDSNIEKLTTQSITRQKQTPEFNYLDESISWFKQKQNQNEYALNLKARIDNFSKDENKTKSLNNVYQGFSEESFESRNIVLDIVDKQQEKSLRARGEEISPAPSPVAEYKKSKNLDIRLHETLRIVSDWLDLREIGNLTKHKTSPKNLPKAEI